PNGCAILTVTAAAMVAMLAAMMSPPTRPAVKSQRRPIHLDASDTPSVLSSPCSDPPPDAGGGWVMRVSRLDIRIDPVEFQIREASPGDFRRFDLTIGRCNSLPYAKSCLRDVKVGSAALKREKVVTRRLGRSGRGSASEKREVT